MLNHSCFGFKNPATKARDLCTFDRNLRGKCSRNWEASSHRAPETLRTLFPPAWPLSGAKQSSTNSGSGASPGSFLQLWISVNDHSTKIVKVVIFGRISFFVGMGKLM